MAQEPPKIQADIPLEFPEELKRRARIFFEKAGQVAYALQYDYAIELYLEGLSVWPDAVDEGHKPLWEIALRRSAGGGKKSGMTDSSKYRKMSGKNDKDAMLKAEYLWAKDPSNISHIADILKSSVKAGFKLTAAWIADILFDNNNKSSKPDFNIYILLRDTYADLKNFNRAVQACQLALQIKPRNQELEEALRNLSARDTLQKGRYEEDGDFRDSIKDRHQQELMHESEQLTKSEDFHKQAIDQARKAYQHDPEGKGNLEKLVKALCDTELPEFEIDAIATLEEAFKRTHQFLHKQRAGEIRFKQYRRQIRLLHEQHKKQPADQSILQKYNALLTESLQAELDHYKLCVENYPTDRKIKFEYGKRLLRARLFDDAIPYFQESRTDPRFRVTALNSIGMCFFYKEWFPDAIESFQQAFDAVDDKEGAMAKELLYNLGRAYESDKNNEEALKCYRKVTQIDYNYSDAKNRVDQLRKMQRDNNP